MSGHNLSSCKKVLFYQIKAYAGGVFSLLCIIFIIIFKKCKKGLSMSPGY